MTNEFNPKDSKFAPIPIDDSVLVLTHLQNDFWHPDGAYYDLTRQTLPTPDVIDRIEALIDTCRASGIPIIYHNESFRPGHPEVRIRRNGYALGSARSLGAREGNIAVRGTWGAEVLDRLKPDPNRDEFAIENAKVDPFTCSEFEPLLRNLDRNILILVGLAVNFGIEMTARTASEKDYGACVLSDCTDRLFGTYTEATLTTLLPHYARVTTSEVVLEELRTQKK
ncbi:cysteine hydrolase family protein [Sphingosinicella rhizophila]|uniref:Isochorismatase family cysteine hydrolase n=1 Tax=Sphingosinicella rhizophila TaxID=3050082 RepID=A0ABU3QB73_9SPHN|nr:isochorismatase family cysteine hydrolase [Sphingosinicella sp. GR2756]MDT9600542.1 isochorismatase family cysteine hydrolase [Sphingosinicella sp. GR2756]